MVKNFVYNDIVLYAKGWYERSESITDDLGYLFSKVYAWTPKTEKEVSYMMLRALDRLYVELNIPSDCPAKWFNTHASFEEEVNKRMSIYEYSREMAIIYLVLAVFQGLSKDEIQLIAPKYGKREHFRMGSLFGKNPISMTYTEMNRRAKKMFC